MYSSYNTLQFIFLVFKYVIIDTMKWKYRNLIENFYFLSWINFLKVVYIFYLLINRICWYLSYHKNINHCQIESSSGYKLHKILNNRINLKKIVSV